jgi:hypothetical protein
MISNIFEKSSKKFELCPVGLTNIDRSLVNNLFARLFYFLAILFKYSKTSNILTNKKIVDI